MCARNQDATQLYRLGGMPAWFDGLRRVWEDQRAGSTLPDADELFLADLCEFMPNLNPTERTLIFQGFFLLNVPPAETVAEGGTLLFLFRPRVRLGIPSPASSFCRADRV